MFVNVIRNFGIQVLPRCITHFQCRAHPARRTVEGIDCHCQDSTRAAAGQFAHRLDTVIDIYRRIDLEAGTATDHQVGELETGGSASMKDIVKHAAQELERDLIVKALEATAGNVTQAARRLKISRKSLQLKMKDLGLREPPTEP